MNGKKLAVDGSFGVNTEYAVKDFQKVNGLAVDGSYGPRTAAMLYSILSEEA
jgi:peptidoglycan hydrolase-like protein with peptidoglycan-binding domain